jgi:fructokinase
MIACAGESLVDFTPVAGAGGRLSAFRLHPGGSPFNVAVGVGRLGQAAAFVGRLSDDLFGPLLASHLDEAGVSRELAVTGPEPTALAFVAGGDGEPQYSFRLAGTAAFALRPDDVLAARRPGRVRALHFGSLAIAFPPSAGTILGLARDLKGRALLSLDPNVRPEAIPDWPAYRSALGECLRLADLVKLSEADLAALGLDGPGALRTSPGPVAVVVTRGAAGSRVHLAETVLDCPALPSRVVDTVGAGDAYAAGLLAALADRGALDRPRLERLDPAGWLEAARFASAAAALTCERPGADPPVRTAVLERLSSSSP